MDFNADLNHLVYSNKKLIIKPGGPCSHCRKILPGDLNGLKSITIIKFYQSPIFAQTVPIKCNFLSNP